MSSENKGFAMLQKMGFKPGSGLGKTGLIVYEYLKNCLILLLSFVMHFWEWKNFVILVNKIVYFSINECYNYLGVMLIKALCTERSGFQSCCG